jgi:hypothetical protein
VMGLTFRIALGDRPEISTRVTTPRGDRATRSLALVGAPHVDDRRRNGLHEPGDW